MTIHDETAELARRVDRHLVECEMRNAEATRWMEAAAKQRERMEEKIDAMLASMNRAKGGLAVLMVVGGGVAGLISWVTAKLTAPGVMK